MKKLILSISITLLLLLVSCGESPTSYLKRYMKKSIVIHQDLINALKKPKSSKIVAVAITRYAQKNLELTREGEKMRKKFSSEPDLSKPDVAMTALIKKSQSVMRKSQLALQSLAKKYFESKEVQKAFRLLSTVGRAK